MNKKKRFPIKMLNIIDDLFEKYFEPVQAAIWRNISSKVINRIKKRLAQESFLKNDLEKQTIIGAQ